MMEVEQSKLPNFDMLSSKDENHTNGVDSSMDSKDGNVLPTKSSQNGMDALRDISDDFDLDEDIYCEEPVNEDLENELLAEDEAPADKAVIEVRYTETVANKTDSDDKVECSKTTMVIDEDVVMESVPEIENKVSQSSDECLDPESENVVSTTVVDKIESESASVVNIRNSFTVENDIPTLSLVDDEDDADSALPVVENTKSDTKSEDSKNSDKDNDEVVVSDSDDEVVFFMDKPEENTETSKELEKKNSSDEVLTTVEACDKIETESDAKPVVEEEDDDVVLLEDDMNDINESVATAQEKEEPVDIASEHEAKKAEEAEVISATAEETVKEKIDEDSYNRESDDEVVILDDDNNEKPCSADEEVEAAVPTIEEDNKVSSSEIVEPELSSKENELEEKEKPSNEKENILEEKENPSKENVIEQPEASTDLNESKQVEATNETIKAVKAREAMEGTGDVEKLSSLVFDNTDNARDNFEVEKSSEGTPKPAEEGIKSNDSSSSNLLLEAMDENNECAVRKDTENENEEETEKENESIGDGGADEQETSSPTDSSAPEDNLMPPAKRIRLSTENENCSEKITDCSKNNLTVAHNETQVKTLKEISSQVAESNQRIKRTYESIDTPEEEKVEKESVTKKPKTEEPLKTDAETSKAEEEDDDIILVNDEVNDKKPKTETKEDIKLIKDEKSTELPKVELSAKEEMETKLYPAPKLEDIKTDFSLDFLRRFQKSFSKMTKADLEELVLQKVVEAIVYKSEFSEMRLVVDAQEKLLSSHRKRIAELGKQFRDLEMVHNRVIQDLETKNSQYILPVKITRAVGLQVYMPSPKKGNDTAPLSQLKGDVPTPTPRPADRTVAQLPTSPQRQNNLDANKRQAGTVMVPPTQSVNISTRRSTGPKPAPAPTRQVESTPARSVAPSSYHMTTQQAIQQQYNTLPQQQNSTTRILNKNASPTVAQRNHLQQQPRVPPQKSVSPVNNLNNANSLRKISPKPGVVQTSPQQQQQQSQFRRPEQLPKNASTQINPDGYINKPTNVAPVVSIVAAKPKDKTFIDLTDEDDNVVTTPPAAPRPRAAVSGIGSTNATQQTNFSNNRTVPPMTRIPGGATQAGANKQPLSSARSNTVSTSVPRPGLAPLSAGSNTTITRVHAAASNTTSARAKYCHPAPLPPTPTQVLNPAWKLPPPRPTIRINNHENGIVISWTMEESMERFAECLTYQIFAYQETSAPPMVDSWRHVGDVKAMLLPMAVTLTQFQEGQRYYFAVRAIDAHQRIGPFSQPKTWF